MSRWEPYMRDWQGFVSPYQRSADPAGQFRGLAVAAGLQVRDVTAPRRTFVYSSRAELEAALAAVSPFVSRVPEHDRHDYVRDCADAVICITGVDERGAVTSEYQLIVACVARGNR